MARGVKIEDWETEEALALLKSVSSLTMEEIATRVIGLKSRRTLYNWCRKSEAINKALQQKVDEETRREVEAEVIKSCFDRKMKVKTKKQTLDRDGVVHDLVEEREIALPAYKTALAGGKAANDAGVLTLLCLIANVYDTNLYKRGGDEGVRFAREYARALLATGDPSLSQICQMDVALTERNLSPGGCADLLALTYFLTELEGQRQIEMIGEILMITKN